MALRGPKSPWILLSLVAVSVAQDAEEALTVIDFQNTFQSSLAYRVWGAAKRKIDWAGSTIDADYTCFSGLPDVNLCQLAQPYSSDAPIGNAESYLGDSGNWQSGSLQGSNVDDDNDASWCLSCCDNSRPQFVFNETFAMQCPLFKNPIGTDYWESTPEDGDGTNTVTWEFRFARLLSLDDNGFVSCDLQMDSRESYHGYSLTVIVVERDDGNGKYWRGVKKCHAVGIKDDPSPAATIWWQDTLVNEGLPCWASTGSAEATCLYQQITVTNEYEWCNQNYAYLGQYSNIYESGFEDLYEEEVISTPTWDELEADTDPWVEGDNGYVFAVGPEYCGASVETLSFALGVLSIAALVAS